MMAQGKVPLVGGDGSDTLNGGAGNDSSTGGNGPDIFVIAAGQGTDLIVDLDLGDDVIGLANGLSFNELTFSSGDILLGDEVLATLTGVDATTLSESDFTTV